MLRYLITRVFQLVLVLFVVSILVFAFTSVMGNPVYLMVRENATEDEIQAVVEYLGLDKPLPIQYGIFVKKCFKGGLWYILYVPSTCT